MCDTCSCILTGPGVFAQCGLIEGWGLTHIWTQEHKINLFGEDYKISCIMTGHVQIQAVRRIEGSTFSVKRKAGLLF